jgi:hypothetical protein
MRIFHSTAARPLSWCSPASSPWCHCWPLSCRWSKYSSFS